MSSPTNNDNEWFDVGNHKPIDEIWMENLFPTKDPAKRAKFLSVLATEEFETTADLALLDDDGWNQLALPLAIKNQLKAAVGTMGSNRVNSTTPNPPTPPLVKQHTAPLALPTQLDCVVIDCSMSMRAASALDAVASEGYCPKKTREDISKMLFHTMIDKCCIFELNHSLGLIHFGERIECTPKPPKPGEEYQLTNEYEKFHDELGRLDADQRATALYDAIFEADKVLAKAQLKLGEAGKSIPKRIFVLTDGEDNRSQQRPWQVAAQLQRSGTVLDAIPLGSYNSTLHAICLASGGICFGVGGNKNENPLEQAIGLFEREATLCLSSRELLANDKRPPGIASVDVFNKLVDQASSSAPTRTIKSALPKAVFAKTLAPKEALASLASAPANTRRILKEYSNGMPNGWRVFISADNVHQWKATFSGTPGTPYEGGTWLLSIKFTATYPFSEPSVKFITPIYHTNISPDGMICKEALKEAWSPASTIRGRLDAIAELLRSPVAHNPLDAFKAALYRDDRAAYLVAAAEHTAQHASASIGELAVKYNLNITEEGEAHENNSAGETAKVTKTTTTTTTTVVTKTSV